MKRIKGAVFECRKASMEPILKAMLRLIFVVFIIIIVFNIIKGLLV